MTTLVYKFEIPDRSRPIPGATGSAPECHLMPFTPAPLNVAALKGQRSYVLMTRAGTYGMGGPGFLALELEEAWLVVALWGAASWTTCQGRLVEDMFWKDEGRPRPWIDEESGDALGPKIVGQIVKSVDVTRTSLRIALSGGYDLTIAEDPATRPIFAGNKQPRAFAPDDDLSRAVFLSPTIELWV